jgi:transposase
MPEKQRKYDPEFRDGAVRVVQETGKTIPQVADDLGIDRQTLANWVASDQVKRGETRDPRRADSGRVRELERQVEELTMERDVLKRSALLWVKEAMR